MGTKADQKGEACISVCEIYEDYHMESFRCLKRKCQLRYKLDKSDGICKEFSCPFGYSFEASINDCK